MAGKSGISISVAGRSDLRAAIVPRIAESDKRTSGKVLVVGGSADFHGAPALAYSAAYAMLSALRAGAGYVSAFVPESALLANRKVSPNVIVRPFAKDVLSMADVPKISDSIRHSDSVVIGPGLGGSNRSALAVAKLVRVACTTKKAAVVDADAIAAVSRAPELNRSVVLTPNKNEFERAWGRVPKGEAAAVKAVAKVSQEIGACVLLKGHRTIISDGRTAKLVKSSSAALATMGTGDVLSGIIAGLAASNHDTFKSAVAGAYLHSRIGDVLHKKIGDRILATDVIDEVPAALMGELHGTHRMSQ